MMLVRKIIRIILGGVKSLKLQKYLQMAYTLSSAIVRPNRNSIMALKTSRSITEPELSMTSIYGLSSFSFVTMSCSEKMRLLCLIRRMPLKSKDLFRDVYTRSIKNVLGSRTIRTHLNILGYLVQSSEIFTTINLRDIHSHSTICIKSERI